MLRHMYLSVDMNVVVITHCFQNIISAIVSLISKRLMMVVSNAPTVISPFNALFAQHDIPPSNKRKPQRTTQT